ncbi:cytochrome P450 [Micromonospora auratinigra]|uniref:Cytochrome P450 n=1 Tax=Micromonospora auratinigra TaxID=261654 RepID=A0A1A8ZGZ5_9ACTN|nr:cytochrome P450 [Micromonospora auratinigra]SBT43114.1 Cytochrome P450 [Micromonospora auratinigra]
MSVDPTPLVDPRSYVDGVPYELLAALRAQAAVVRVAEPPLLGLPAGPGFWLVLRHAEVTDVLRRPGLFSSWRGGTQIRDPATAEDLGYVRQMMLNRDPPEHGRLRRPVARAFTPRAVATLEESIRANAVALVERVLGDADEGSFDFVRDLAADLPLLTLADVLGVPEADRWLLYDWSNRVIGFQDPEHATSAAFDPRAGTAMAREALRHRPTPAADGRLPDPRTRAGMADLYAYAHLLAAAKRREPGADVMSVLLAERGDERLSVTEFENMFWLFAVAGNETVRNALPGALIALLEHPAELARLRRDPGLFDTAVDELLRWWTPVMVFRRTATADTTVGGVPVRAGEKVVVSFASANRDERVFVDPDRLDLGRHPNPHLGFGHGPHFCLGAQLARCQLRALLAALLSRTTELGYAGRPTYLRSNFQRGVKRLPVRWRRRRPST